MKRFGAVVGVMAIGSCLLALAADPAQRQNITSSEGDASAAQAGKLDDVTRGANIRASQLIGMNIQNEEGKSLGSINDIVIDAESGRVRYAAVSYGGFLGLGDKLFAVPWGAFKYRRGSDDNTYHLVLNATESQLKTATGFDQNNWPNFADPKFTSELDRHYGVQGQAEGRRGRVDVQVGPGGVDVDVNRQRRNDRNR